MHMTVGESRMLKIWLGYSTEDFAAASGLTYSQVQSLGRRQQDHVLDSDVDRRIRQCVESVQKHERQLRRAIDTSSDSVLWLYDYLDEANFKKYASPALRADYPSLKAWRATLARMAVHGGPRLQFRYHNGLYSGIDNVE